MQTPSLNEIKKTLTGLDSIDLASLCMRLAKYKKENKELLSYLLFEAENERQYIESIQSETDILFENLVFSNSYTYTKQIRKILRFVHKHIRYSGKPETEVELLMHFCRLLKPNIQDGNSMTALKNVYSRQLEKAEKAMQKLHEDIQYDYVKEFEQLKRINW